MAKGGTLTFGDADAYAAGFGDAHIILTITGAGAFEARVTQLKLNHLEVYRCYENLPRIAYLSLPPDRIFLWFPISATALVADGLDLRNGDLILHGRGVSTHQRSFWPMQMGLDSGVG
jgi:hypothetical protein